MLSHLRATNVLLPAATVLERIGLAARVRARKKAFQGLADGLTDAKRDALDKLLVLDPNVRRSRFAWLRDYAESPAPSNMLGLIDRLDYIRDLGIGSERTGRIHAARLDRLVEEGAIMTVQHFANLEPARRTAILVAQVANAVALGGGDEDVLIRHTGHRPYDGQGLFEPLHADLTVNDSDAVLSGFLGLPESRDSAAEQD